MNTNAPSEGLWTTTMSHTWITMLTQLLLTILKKHLGRYLVQQERSTHSLNFGLFLRYFLREVGCFRDPKFGRKNSVTRLFEQGNKRYSCFEKWATHETHISSTKYTDHCTM